MNKFKNLVVIGSICIALILIGLLTWQFISKNDLASKNMILQEKNDELQKNTETLNTEINRLNTELEISNNQVNLLNDKIKELGGQGFDTNAVCTFTKTFQYLETVNYIGQANERFIVFNEYQSFAPFVVRLSQEFNLKLEKDAYYEIKFKSTLVDKDNVTKYTVLSIKKTDKKGNDQIQEDCSIN